MKNPIEFLAKGQSQFINLARIAIFIVMVGIGSLKAFQYGADGIGNLIFFNHNHRSVCA